MKRDHIQVLKTMYESGLLSRQAMKTVRGQIMNMKSWEREEYLRQVIKGTARKAGGRS